MFIAGQVPLGAAGELVGLGASSAQAIQCLDNLWIVLGVHGPTSPTSVGA